MFQNSVKSIRMTAFSNFGLSRDPCREERKLSKPKFPLQFGGFGLSDGKCLVACFFVLK